MDTDSEEIWFPGVLKMVQLLGKGQWGEGEDLVHFQGWQDSVGSAWGLGTDVSPLGIAHWLQTGITAQIPGPQWEILAEAQKARNLS